MYWDAMVNIAPSRLVTAEKMLPKNSLSRRHPGGHDSVLLFSSHFQCGRKCLGGLEHPRLPISGLEAQEKLSITREGIELDAERLIFMPRSQLYLEDALEMLVSQTCAILSSPKEL